MTELEREKHRADEATGEVEKWRLRWSAMEDAEDLARRRAARWKALARRMRRERNWMITLYEERLERHESSIVRLNAVHDERDAARWQAFGLAWAAIGWAAKAGAMIVMAGEWMTRFADTDEACDKLYDEACRWQNRVRELEAALHEIQTMRWQTNAGARAYDIADAVLSKSRETK